MSDNKYIKGPFKADFHGGYVFSGPDNFMFAQVRGWGELGYKKEGEAIQDANLQFMVDALNEKASGALKKAGDEIADLAHPEFGEMGRLQEELHEEKKAHSTTRELVTVGIGARLELSDKLELLKSENAELQKEVEWLRYYKRNVYQCLGPGDDDINRDIIKSFVREKGIDALPKQERIWHLEYLDEHKGG